MTTERTAAGNMPNFKTTTMNYTQNEIGKIIQAGESEKVEFKTLLRDPVLLSRIIGSFANRDGGLILIGVREPIEIVGCDFKQLQLVFERAKSMVKPTPNISLDSIQIDNKIIGIIKVEKSNEIVFAAGGVFERVGDNTIAMNSQSIKNKLIQVSTPVSNESLAKAIEQQTKIIEDLREEIKNSGSFKNYEYKWKIIFEALNGITILTSTESFSAAFKTNML